MLHASLQDSGSAMRALKPSLLAPSFDVILHAGEPLDVQATLKMSFAFVFVRLEL